jgi:hypothetical protein
MINRSSWSAFAAIMQVVIKYARMTSIIFRDTPRNNFWRRQLPFKKRVAGMERGEDEGEDVDTE